MVQAGNSYIALHGVIGNNRTLQVLHPSRVLWRACHKPGGCLSCPHPEGCCFGATENDETGWTNRQLERRWTSAQKVEKVIGGACSGCMGMSPWVCKVSPSPACRRGKKCSWDSHSAWEGSRDSHGCWWSYAWEHDVMWRYRTELMNSLPSDTR